MNKDGHLDLVLGHGNHNDQVLLNSGSGSGSALFVSASDMPGQKYTTSALALGDIDGDGALDVLSVTDWNGVNQLFLNGGDGTSWTAVALSSNSMSTQTPTVAIADLNGDGNLDAILGNSGTSSVMLLNDGSGQVSNARKHRVSHSPLEYNSRHGSASTRC